MPIVGGSQGLMVQVNSITTSTCSDDAIWSTLEHIQQIQGMLRLIVVAIRELPLRSDTSIIGLPGPVPVFV